MALEHQLRCCSRTRTKLCKSCVAAAGADDSALSKAAKGLCMPLSSLAHWSNLKKKIKLRYIKLHLCSKCAAVLNFSALRRSCACHRSKAFASRNSFFQARVTSVRSCVGCLYQ